MLPEHFEGCNARFEKPNSWSDEQCSGIDAMIIDSPETGGKVIRTYWKPSKEDIDAILDGRGLVLDIHSSVMVPVAIFTFDGEGQINA